MPGPELGAGQAGDLPGAPLTSIRDLASGPGSRGTWDSAGLAENSLILPSSSCEEKKKKKEAENVMKDAENNKVIFSTGSLLFLWSRWQPESPMVPASGFA